MWDDALYHATSGGSGSGAESSIYISTLAEVFIGAFEVIRRVVHTRTASERKNTGRNVVIKPNKKLPKMVFPW